MQHLLLGLVRSERSHCSGKAAEFKTGSFQKLWNVCEVEEESRRPCRYFNFLFISLNSIACVGPVSYTHLTLPTTGS